MNMKLIVSKKSSGKWKVDVVKNYRTLGNFETNDSQLIDDIDSVKNGNKPIHYESYSDIIELCLNKIKEN